MGEAANSRVPKQGRRPASRAIMADYHIDCVNKSDRNSPHKHITHVGGPKVLAHPRRTSLTGRAADARTTAATEGGHVIEWADLVAEKFDPVLQEADEPDWSDRRKVYSAAVRQ